MRRGRGSGGALRGVGSWAATAAALSLGAGPALAWDFYYAPFADLNFEVNDNRQLRPDSDGTAYGVTARGGGQFGWRTAVQDLNFRPYASVSRYPGKELLDSQVLYLGGDWSSRLKRGRWGLRASYFRFDTLTQGVRFFPGSAQTDGTPAPVGPEPGPEPEAPDNQPDVPEPGLFTEALISTTLRFSPYFEHEFSAADRLRLEYSAERTENEGRFSYDSDRVSAQYTHALSAARNWGGRLNVGRYDSDNGRFTVDALEALAGYEHGFSPLLSATAYAGFAYLSPDGVARGTQSSGSAGNELTWLAEARVRLRGRQMRGDASLTRSLVPQSNVEGVLLRTQATVQGSYALGPLQEAHVALRAFNDSAAAGGSSRNERIYVDFSAGYRWQLSRSFRAGVNYQFRLNDPRAGENAQSNAVFLNLYYDGAATMIAR